MKGSPEDPAFASQLMLQAVVIVMRLLAAAPAWISAIVMSPTELELAGYLLAMGVFSVDWLLGAAQPTCSPTMFANTLLFSIFRTAGTLTAGSRSRLATAIM